MKFFRPVNTNSRFPAWLQNGTKANTIWQLKMALGLTAFMIARDEIKFRMEQKNRKAFLAKFQN